MWLLSLSVRKRWFGLVLIVLAISVAKAAIIELPHDKLALLNDINQHPAQVIESVEAALDDSNLSALERAHYYFILNDAYYATFRAPESLNAATQGLRYASEVEDDVLTNAIKVKIARAYDSLPDPKPGIRYADEALAWAKHTKHLEIQIEAMTAIGSIELALSDYVSALNAFVEAYKLAQNSSHELSDIVAPNLALFIGLVYEAQEKHEQSIPYFEEATNHYRKTDNKVELSNALYGLGLAYGKLDQLDKAINILNESMALSVELGDKQGQAYTTQALVDILFIRDDVHSSEQLEQLGPLLDEAIETFTKSGNVNMQIQTLIIKAKWYEKSGRLNSASELLAGASALSAENNIDLYDVQIQQGKARLLAESGDFEGAYAALKAAHQTEQIRRDNVDEDKLRELRASFELEQKEYQNRLLAEVNARQNAELEVSKQERTIIILAIGALAIVFIATVVMYANVKRQHKQMKRLAQTDELTGLYNRRQTLRMLEREKRIAVRQNQPLSVAIADLDDFKYINDTYGHQVGDEVLRHVGKMIKMSFRNTDITGRIGGEEFLFVFPAAACDEVAVSLRHFMDDCALLPDSLKRYDDMRISFSMGLVDAQDEDAISSTLAKADKLMYQAKAQGKDQVVIR